MSKRPLATVVLTAWGYVHTKNGPRNRRSLCLPLALLGATLTRESSLLLFSYGLGSVARVTIFALPAESRN